VGPRRRLHAIILNLGRIFHNPDRVQAEIGEIERELLIQVRLHGRSS